MLREDRVEGESRQIVRRWRLSQSIDAGIVRTIPRFSSLPNLHNYDRSRGSWDGMRADGAGFSSPFVWASKSSKSIVAVSSLDPQSPNCLRKIGKRESISQDDFTNTLQMMDNGLIMCSMVWGKGSVAKGVSEYLGKRILARDYTAEGDLDT